MALNYTLTPGLWWWWAIKILLKQRIENTPLFVDQYLSHPPSLLAVISKRFTILFISLYSFCSFVKWSNSLPSWNVENGGCYTMWCTHNPHIHQYTKIHGWNWYLYGNKWITLPMNITGLSKYEPRYQPIPLEPPFYFLPFPYQFHSLSHIRTLVKYPSFDSY